MKQAIKTYFLNRHKDFVECEVVKETNHKRVIEILEGDRKGKKMSVHPMGVSTGKLYPRVFEATEKPDNFFVFKGRVLMAHKEPTPLVPAIDKHYRFQPWLSHVIDNINANINTLLSAGMGTGKTTHIVQLAARINQPLIRINFNAETRLSDFIGKIHVVGGETKWTDGVLPTAMKQGTWLLLDELDSADPAILSMLNPVLEDSPVLTLKENNGEVIKPHPNFRIFATANSVGAMQDKAGLYAGTNQLNAAFLDRWCVMTVPNLPFKEEIKLLKSKVRGIKNRYAKRIVEFANRIREGNSEINFNENTFSTRLTLAWAQRSALLNSPLEGAKIAWLDKIPASERDGVMRVLETFFGNKERKNKAKAPTDGLVLKKRRGRPKKAELQTAVA